MRDALRTLWISLVEEKSFPHGCRAFGWIRGGNEINFLQKANGSDPVGAFESETEGDEARRGDTSVQDPKQSAESLWAYYEGILLVAKARRDPEIIRRLGQDSLYLLHVT